MTGERWGFDMGKIGRSYPRAAHRNSASALARFDRPLTQDQVLAMRPPITSGFIGLLCFLVFIGWVLAN